MIVKKYVFSVFSGTTDFRAEFTVPYAVDYWIKGGFPAKKIALGMGTYGRAFRLKDKGQNGLAAPTILGLPQPPKGKFTREAGFLAYYEICKMGLTIVKDNAVSAPYGYKGDIWVGFDDKASLVHKVNTQIKGKTKPSEGLQSCIENPELNIKMDILKKIRKDFKLLTIFAKKFHLRCLTGLNTFLGVS